jgi:glutamyl-tRNA synthetase
MIKTRFAPSPTGYLHAGGLRTALYCYLFARKNKGKFVLRIEDTDQERYVEGTMENLIKTLEWIGLEYNEGPYIQSQRTEIYREHADKLIKSGHAYHCFCTKQRLEEMREKQTERKQAPMYDRKCLDLPESEIKAKIHAKKPFVIREKIPYETIKFKDLIRGNVQFDGKTIDDQVLVKSDGFPTYHLANVVDDHLMEITHVIRGEEWLPSTPKHLALYKAFGWDPPQFAHLPLLLNPDKTKLSKRQGHVAVEDYIKQGYLKEAIINFVAFLGWNPGGGEEKEIFTLKELEEIFSLEKVHKAGAVFNIEKLDWFNWRWQKENFAREVQGLSEEQKAEKLLEKCSEHIPESLKKDKPKLLKALLTVEEKILKDPKGTCDNINFYYNLPSYNKELLTHEKMRVNLQQAQKSLTASHEDLEKLEDWSTQESLKQTLLKTVERLAVKNGQLLWPLRSALTGLPFSPGVFEAAFVLGKKESLSRIQKALTKLK